jgi:uncharacterized protein YqeY
MKDRINKDFLEAFKAGNKVKKDFLGLIKGEIQSEEKRGNNVDVDAILKKMEKSLKQTNTAESLAELEILKEYLPQMMDEVTIRAVLYSYYKDGVNTLPLLMKKFNEENKGKADNQLVMTLIKELV